MWKTRQCVTALSLLFLAFERSLAFAFTTQFLIYEKKCIPITTTDSTHACGLGIRSSSLLPAAKQKDDTDAENNDDSFLSSLSSSISDSLGRPIQLQYTSTRAGGSGGGGASTFLVFDPSTETNYFVKSAPMKLPFKRRGDDMLLAEYMGVSEMAQSNTVRVPEPIAFGTDDNEGKAFVIFEFLDFTHGCSGYELGKQLANMHKCTSPDNKFGFHINNTIGATPQPNVPSMSSWADFWEEHRLNHMLALTRNVGGMSDLIIEELRTKTRELLSEHDPVPSLLHGDLWGGNKGCVSIDGEKVNVIFDPATYYGDREADIAMTYLFGGFANDFYDGYDSEWPLPDGHEKRRTIYNLYHILNHYVLFGGSYRRQARDMIKEIIKY